MLAYHSNSFKHDDAEKMATQREKDAADYLKKHKIIELMDNLTGMLFFYRPGQTLFRLSVFTCVVLAVANMLDRIKTHRLVMSSL